MSTEDVVLVAGTLVQQQLSDGTWARIPKVSSTGATGEKAEPKEKTTVGDIIKKYGTGMQEAPEKTFKVQVIPTQDTGSQYEVDRALQQLFIASAKAKESMQMRVTWPDLERATMAIQTLGYEVDDATADAWKIATIMAKQNSVTQWGTAPAMTDITVSGETALTAATEYPLTWVPEPLDSFYVADTTFTTSDEAVAIVSDAGVITAVATGSADITVIMHGISKVHAVTVT